MNSVTISDWAPLLQSQFDQRYWKDLQAFVAAERCDRVIYPAPDDVLAALHFTSYANTKVVILGQDPYHSHGQAHGLAFSVPPSIPVPPSLCNIYRELKNDLGCLIPNHGNLESWAKQGVLLLNSTLTVQSGRANSHHGRGWELFTDRIIDLINEKNEHVAFLLWGAAARHKKSLLDDTRHTVLESAHPSPLSAHRGFFGSRPFSQANTALVKNGREPINWSIANL